MSKLMDITTEAQSALLATAPRTGAAVAAPLPVLSELSINGLIGAGHGLTCRGTIERERIFTARMDAAL